MLRLTKSVLLALVLVSANASYANETMEGIKSSASDAATKAKEVAGQVYDKSKDVAVDVYDKSKEVGSEIGDASSKLWHKAKEVGSATAGAVRDGAGKVKDYIDENACESDSVTQCTEE